jgi:hypothetical protein
LKSNHMRQPQARSKVGESAGSLIYVKPSGKGGI